MRRLTASFERFISEFEFARSVLIRVAALSIFGIAVFTTSGSIGQQGSTPEKPAASNTQAVPPPADPPENQPEAPPIVLPENFKPPGAKPADLQIEKPLLTPAEEKELSIELRKKSHRTVLNRGELNRETTDLLKKIARYDVHRLSMPSHRRDLEKIRKELMSHLQAAARIPATGAQRKAFRDFFLQQVMERTIELLDGNFHVRINAALVLGSLNSVEYDAQNGNPAVPYAPALKPLMGIIRNQNQRQAVKLVAVKGINRMTLAAIPSTAEQVELATRFISALKNTSFDKWYHVSLIEAISHFEVTTDREDRAFILQILTEIVADRGRHWLVRSAAAKGLGRARYNEGINIHKIIYEIVKLGREMIDAYNVTPGAYYWKNCFFNLYLAFQPLNEAEAAKDYGFIKQDFGNDSLFIRGAYHQILPLTSHVVIKGLRQSIQQPQINPINDWLQKNVPANNRIANNLPPIQTKQAVDPQKPPAR